MEEIEKMKIMKKKMNKNVIKLAYHMLFQRIEI